MFRQAIRPFAAAVTRQQKLHARVILTQTAKLSDSITVSVELVDGWYFVRRIRLASDFFLCNTYFTPFLFSYLLSLLKQHHSHTTICKTLQQ